MTSDGFIGELITSTNTSPSPGTGVLIVLQTSLPFSTNYTAYIYFFMKYSFVINFLAIAIDLLVIADAKFIVYLPA